MAYYAKKPDDQKQLVRNFLKRLDANGDGKVTIQEYLDYAKEMGFSRHLTPNLFKLLDKYDDGTLDFEECITLFYMDKGHGLLLCDGCGSHILGIHFICVECFNISRRTFDLCCSCYRNNNFNHVHSSASFLDNYALLRTKRKEDIKEKMEEMGEVAMAYYAKLPDDQKQLVVSFYKRLDANGDGKVSIQEYSDFVKEIGLSRFLTPNMFKLLDKDDDGTLDFEECVTFFYMYKSHRLVFCDGCGSYILGIHFTCVECYNVGKGTYDLCCSCYHNNNFNNVHSFFLDNYALLGYLRNKKREKELEDVSRGIETGCRIAPVTQPAAVAHPAAAVKSHSRRKELEEGIRGFETGVRLFKIVHDAAVANPHAVHAVATNCTIM
ncbi:hypothetical protein Vadar_010378 [Vaccinium darrowii]|uniref:Uncharacterized protein n=1 Tax=Vaccinium darrowii TaxID=229202 RepID=A0ACB7YVF7_9ERIC|nr:hypothetical protein Vadar_010378 [Vaccinium darrowii]